MEDVNVLELSTGKSVANIKELRDYIKDLKAALNDEGKTLQENAKDAEDLRAAQDALKNAMYATTKSAGDYIKESQQLLSVDNQLNGSYNDLVKTLADLKSAWRATTDEAARADLTAEIKRVNDALKDMDEQTGNFKRNVGNYANSFKEAFGELPPVLQPVDKGIKNVTRSLDLIGKQPIIGTVLLLAPVLAKIVQELKKNETAIEAVKKLMASLQPVFDVVGKVIQTIAEWLSKVIDRFVGVAGESGETFKKIISGAVGVGNSILQFLLTPIRSVIEAFKGLGNVVKDVFTGQFKKIKEDAGAAIRGIGDAFKKGFDFKGNFELGKQAGEAFISGLGSTRAKAKETAAGIKQDVVEEMEDAAEILLYTWEELEKRWEDAQRQREEKEKKRWELYNQLRAENANAAKEIDKDLLASEQAVQDELDAMLEESIEKQTEALNRQIAIKNARVELAWSLADSVGAVLDYMADIYEADAEESEKSAKTAKNLRIASATVDTISGAIAAYMNGVKTIPIPSWAGIALGVIQAATVAAAGAAQIARIKATNISRNSTSPGVSVSAPSASAPALPQSVQQTALVQAAYNTQQLNESAADNRVYILQSDLEASGRQVQVREAESTF